jgi:hypothetical protein
MLYDWRDELGIATRRVAELEAHFLAQTERIQRLVQQKRSPIADKRILTIVSNSLEHARSHKQLVESQVGEECPAQSWDCAQGKLPPTYADHQPATDEDERREPVQHAKSTQSYHEPNSIHEQMLRIMSEIAMEADESKI